MNEIKYDTFGEGSDKKFIKRNLILLIYQTLLYFLKLQFIWKFKLSKGKFNKIIYLYNPLLFARIKKSNLVINRYI